MHRSDNTIVSLINEGLHLKLPVISNTLIIIYANITLEKQNEKINELVMYIKQKKKIDKLKKNISLQAKFALS